MSSWLRSMYLECYLEAFLDNGYDELEICKQIGDRDLDAIGVYHPHHRQTIMHQVRILQEKGGFHVYFILDPKYSRPSRDGYRGQLLQEGYRTDVMQKSVDNLLTREDHLVAKGESLVIKPLYCCSTDANRVRKSCIL